MVSDEITPRLVSLKELVPLLPWRTPAPSFPGNRNGQYVKFKKPLVLKDGARVFWAPNKLLVIEDPEEIEDLKIPYQGFFEFMDECVVNNVRRWIDRLLGQIFSLPKYDDSSKSIIR